MMSDEQPPHDPRITDAGVTEADGGVASGAAGRVAEPGRADGRVTASGGLGEPADGEGTAGRDGAGPDAVGSDAPSADGTGTDDEGAEADAGKTRRKRRPFWVELPVLLVIALIIAL